MQTIEETIRLICEYFDNKGIDYSLVGGVTLPLLGAPRSTFDVDIIARIDEKDAKGLAEYLKSRGFLASEDDIIAALREKSHCTIEFGNPPYRIYLKGAYSEREEETLSKAKRLEYLGLKVMVQSPEDAISNKLSFGSEQGIKDAISIFVRQKPTLDMQVLEARCKQLGVQRELDDLISKVKKYPV
jgi:hypothetical protein